MTDAEMDEIRSYSPGFDCPVKAENDECITQRFCDCVCDEFQSDCPFEKLAKKLKTYEDAEDKGTLLRLPCKVGEKVYEPYRFFGEGAWEIDEHYIKLEDLPKIGKTVFLTREEAEMAIERNNANA